MKKALTLILALALALTLCACGSGDEETEDPNGYDSINLAMAVNGTDTQIDTRVANKFKELVEEASGGIVTVDVFPNDQLAGGNAAKGIEMISDGSVDLAAYATSVLSALDERLSIGIVPWLFDSYAQARQVIDATGLDYYDSVLERLDIKVLGSFHNGFRQLTNNKHPVTEPEDLKGLTIRVPGSEVYMSFFRAFGADPNTLNWSEVFTSLQQGAIDGQENGASITASSGMVEVQDYMTIWNYTYENDLFIVNRSIWDNLNEATQALLEEKAREACDWGRDVLEAEEGELIEEFRAEGMQVDILTEEQLEPFKEVVGDLCRSFYEKYGEEACAAFGVELD